MKDDPSSNPSGSWFFSLSILVILQLPRNTGSCMIWFLRHKNEDYIETYFNIKDHLHCFGTAMEHTTHRKLW